MKVLPAITLLVQVGCIIVLTWVLHERRKLGMEGNWIYLTLIAGAAVLGVMSIVTLAS